MKNLIPNQVIFEIANSFETTAVSNRTSKFWSHLINKGSHLWMDTGDIQIASELWTDEFSALTTNNTLLNNEVQKGYYDDCIKKMGAQLSNISIEEKVEEIGFCINAIHGLRLKSIFNCKVSVELHTNYANDVERTFNVGKRLYDICQEHFIVKVPYTPAGLIAARKLHDIGIPVNMTLCFSTRQNVIASMVAQPTYSNVFVGRVGAYFENKGFKKIGNIGEKVTAETQKCLRKVNERGYADTKLIAASIRTAQQLNQLIGTDVLTIPTKVMKECLETNERSEARDIIIDAGITKQLNLKHLWQVSDAERELAIMMNNKVPSSPELLVDLFNQFGSHDVFPKIDEQGMRHLQEDGKIPDHNKWSGRIENFEIGIDALLNQAGLLAFKADQAMLDKRIKSYL